MNKCVLGTGQNQRVNNRSFDLERHSKQTESSFIFTLILTHLLFCDKFCYMPIYIIRYLIWNLIVSFSHMTPFEIVTYRCFMSEYRKIRYS